MGNLSFWLLVPDTRAERAESYTLVFATAALFLAAQVLMLPAILGVFFHVFRRTGVLGGVGATLAASGSLGLTIYVFFLFPELAGFRPDTFHKAQIALAMQAIGELGVAAFLLGWLFLSLAIIATRSFQALAAVPVAIGTLVVPFGLIELRWLAVGACFMGVGIAWMGALLTGTNAGSSQKRRDDSLRQATGRHFRF